MCSLIISLHVDLHVHILKITYYISWLTCTLQRQYLQLKHNTVTDIDSRTIELYAPLNNLISLTPQNLSIEICVQKIVSIHIYVKIALTKKKKKKKLKNFTC